jgi:hypothetical protein
VVPIHRALLLFLLAGCAGSMPPAADPASDAPEYRSVPSTRIENPPTYAEALKTWRGAEDVNAWIGAKFEYDMARAMLLSENQRQNRRMPIHAPEAFFGAPAGVCVDLARFGLETLKAIDPGTKPKYLMIEFDPVSIGGNVLRRHWVVSFEREGRHWFFADSKHPGHLAGPYASAEAFIADYARYRGRRIVSFSERATYERTLRVQAVKKERAAAP